MTTRHYDYKSARSQLVIAQILKIMRVKRGAGCTQAELAIALDMGITGVSRYVIHMCNEGIIHIAVPVGSTQRGFVPALYKLGPPVIIKKRKPAFSNDPLLAAFFGVMKNV